MNLRCAAFLLLVLPLTACSQEEGVATTAHSLASTSASAAPTAASPSFVPEPGVQRDCHAASLAYAPLKNLHRSKDELDQVMLSLPQPDFRGPWDTSLGHNAEDALAKLQGIVRQGKAGAGFNLDPDRPAIVQAMQDAAYACMPYDDANF